jgi:hypothetical protein
MKPQPLKWLSFAYWELSRLFKAIYDDGWAEWKAMAILICAEIFMLMGVYGCISLFIGHRLLHTTSSLSRPLGIMVVLAVIAANYYALLSNNRWSRFEAEFESYSRATRIAGCVGVVGILLGTVVGTLAALTAVRHLSY